MSREDYKEALRLGMKAYRKAVSKGAYPYLPALDDILSNRSVENEISLGIVEVPVDLIVGTRTAGRTTAFANNFMPLLDENTEFASKWISLCGSLMAEGLRDPVVAYEYMNHYYENHISELSSYSETSENLKKIYRNGRTMDKLLVLTVIAAFHIYVYEK